MSITDLSKMYRTKKCVICNNESDPRTIRDKIIYHQCRNCKTLFCEPLDNSNMVGGEFEVERNKKQNNLRLERLESMLAGMGKENVYILDFGCGTGYLIRDIKNDGYKNVDGYDAYFEPYSKLPEENKYNAVIAVEVFEHFSAPFTEIDNINKYLIEGGLLMIETSFVDIANEENIDLDDFFYINPKSGHSILYSHYGLDLLMALRGFTPQQHFNRHVRLYKKTKK